MNISKSVLLTVLLFLGVFYAEAQIDKEKLSLDISKAEEANQLKLKEYVWKRRSDVFIANELKLTVITEFGYTPEGKLETIIIDTKTSIEKKPGLRGKAQASAIEDKSGYVEKSLSLATDYAFMTKGEMLDFFSKATVTEKDGQIEAVSDNVHVDGDRLMIRIDPETYLFTYKEFSTLLGKDKVEGKLNYGKFSNGTNHLSTTILNMPTQNMIVEAKNQDYTIRIK